MGGKKYPIRLRGYTKVVADGTGKVANNRLEPGQLVACQSIAFRNQTGARGAVVLQIRHDDRVEEFAEEPAPAANEWYYYPYAQFIKEGEQIEAAQASCLANDILNLRVIGYIIFESGGEVP